MPKQVRVETPEAFYKSQQQSKKSMWDCLMDIGTDWTFEPGVDFAKGATPRSLIDRLKGWLRNQGHDYKVLRNVGKNGAVTIRLAEWTQEEGRFGINEQQLSAVGGRPNAFGRSRIRDSPAIPQERTQGETHPFNQAGLSPEALGFLFSCWAIWDQTCHQAVYFGHPHSLLSGCFSTNSLDRRPIAAMIPEQKRRPANVLTTQMPDHLSQSLRMDSLQWRFLRTQILVIWEAARRTKFRSTSVFTRSRRKEASR